MFRIIAVFTSACVGGTPSPTSPVVTHTSDTAEATVPVVLEIWEDDRSCYGVSTKDLPEQYWSGWNTNDAYTACLLDIERRVYPTYATTDGLCLRFTNSLKSSDPTYADCIVDDPWIRPCEEVAGCCDRGDNRDYYTCFPSEYEP